MTFRFKRIFILICSAILLLSTVLGSNTGALSQAADSTRPLPVTIDGFENLTLKDFKDSSGNGLPAGEYRSSDSSYGVYEKYHIWEESSNLDKKLVSLYVTYGGGEIQHSLTFGRADWQGLNIRPSGDGQYLFIDSTWARGVLVDGGTYETPVMEASKAGIDSFIGKEFLLQLSFEFDNDDLTIGVYINGNLYNDRKFVIADCIMSNMQSGFGVRVETVNDVPSIIKIDNVEFALPPEEPAEPIWLEGFENLTLKDFTDASGNVLPDGLYNSKSSSYGVFEQYHTVAGVSNLDKKLISIRVLYGGGEVQHSLVFARDDWQGLKLRPSGDGKYLFIDGTWADVLVDTTKFEAPTMEASKAGVPSFVGTEFLLQMSFEYGEADANNKADLTIGVYINGTLYNGEKFVIRDCAMDATTSAFGVRVETVNDEESVIRLTSVETPEPPQEPEEPAAPIELEGFGNLSLGDFKDSYGNVFASGTYRSGANGGTVYEKYCTVPGLSTLDRKLVSMRIMYGGGEIEHSLTFGRSDWKGFNIRPSGDGKYLFIDSTWANGTLVNGNAYETPVMDAPKAGLDSFIGEEFLLQMSFEFDDDDLTIGVYINGKLYNDTNFTIVNCNMSNMQSGLGVRVETVNGVEGVITLTGIGEEGAIPDDPNPQPPTESIQPNKKFEKVTFSDFGIKNAKYQYVDGDLAIQGSLSGEDSLNGKVLCGSILLEGSGMSQIIWAGTGAWNGLRMFPYVDGTMPLIWYNGNETIKVATLQSNIAGVSFLNSEYDIMLSAELVADDKDRKKNDIKIGIWFDGVLYNQEYFIVPNQGENLGDYFGVYCGQKNDTVTLTSVPELVDPPKQPKKPNKNFEKITFDYFGIKDGTYKYDGTDHATAEGKGEETLDRKVLCGEILFSGKGENHFMVGGKEALGYGLRFITQSNGTIALYWIDDTGLTFIENFNSTTAGSKLTEEWINLMISTEIIDADKDGKQDDIELGVWFNGMLYREEYYAIYDKASGLGDMFGFDCTGKDNMITIKSIPEYVKDFNFARYGLTAEWKKTLLATDLNADMVIGGSRNAAVFTGDFFDNNSVFLYITLVLASILFGACVVFWRKRQR